MSELKITIDQLKNYLGTGLKCETIHNTISKVELKIKTFELTGVGYGDNRIPFYTHDEAFCNQFGCIGRYFQSNEFKPICYRLSDLDRHIPELGFVPKDEFFIRYGGGVSEVGKTLWKEIFTENIINSPIGTISFDITQLLFQWNFWPFGDSYFEAGLVIDKLKQTKNEK